MHRVHRIFLNSNADAASFLQDFTAVVALLSCTATFLLHFIWICVLGFFEQFGESASELTKLCPNTKGSVT